jgi:hypothetical protein
LIPAPRRRWLWPGILAVCVLAAGVRSLALGKDTSWDLKNYHYYNAWAFLNDRLGFDLAPAQLQTYHYPFVELPFYWLVNSLADPRAVSFLMAVPTGIAAWFLLRILVLLFPFDRDRANGVLWIGAAALIGLTGAAGAAAWGTTMNEWPSVALTLAALWLCVRATIEGESRRRFGWPAAGLLLGCAVALKLTFGAYALGLLASALMVGTLRERFRRMLKVGVAMGLGFLAAYGPWGLILWREFGNPFFPYFNSVFQSPWWEPVDFFDRNYGPRNWRQWIFFPVLYSRDFRLVGEVSFRDYRLAVLFVLALVAWGVSRWRNLRENPNAPAPPTEPLDEAWRVLVVFALVSYLAWLKVFGIFRYLVALEVVSGALIVGAVLYIAQRGRTRIAIVAVLAFLLVGTTRYGGWGRAEFGDSYFDVRAPRIQPGALVIVGYAHPMAYAAPFFRADARFVSPANNLIGLGQRNRLARRAEELIRGHSGPLYLLQYKVLNGHDRKTLRYFGLASDEAACVPVPSTWDIDHMRICLLRRVSAP